MSLTGWKRWFVLVIGLLENLIFSGSILGWSALNYMLKQEGIFADLCTYESISPPPYRNYTIESTISGQLDRHPILNSYVNYSLLPNVDPVDDEDERIPGPESPALLSLPVPVSSSDVTTLPPADPLIISASNTNHRDRHKGCQAQDRMLNLAYTMGTFFNGFTAFVWGFLLDKWGLRTVRLLINSFLFSGSLLLCFTSQELSFLTFPAIILLCLGGVPIRIANMQFANLFPRNRSTVITFYSGAFSSSAVLFVLLKYAYDAGVSFGTTCFSMVIASLLMLPFTLFVLPADRVRESDGQTIEERSIMKKKYAKGNLALVSSTMITLEKFNKISSPTPERKGIVNTVMEVDEDDDVTSHVVDDEGQSIRSTSSLAVDATDSNSIRKRGFGFEVRECESEIRSASKATPFTGKTIILPFSSSSLKMSSTQVNRSEGCCSGCKVEQSDDCCTCNNPVTRSDHRKSDQMMVVNGKSDDDLRPPSRSPSSTGSSSRSSSTDTDDQIPLSKSLLSIPFSLHQWWYSWLITYMIMYVGTMNLWLDRVTSDRQVAHTFSKVFGIVQILSLILAPIAGFIMDHQVNSADREVDLFKRKLARIKAGFWPMMFTTSTLTAILICRFFNTTVAVYTSIVFITLLRSFLVAVASAYLRIRFPASHFNRLLGIMSTCGAVVTLLQFPLFVWEAHHIDNALWVNLFNCFCTFLAYLNPLHLTNDSLQKRLVAQELENEVLAPQLPDGRRRDGRRESNKA